MSASFTHMTKAAVGDPTALDNFAWLTIDNLEFLWSALVLAQNQGIFNGSFEADSSSLTNEAPAEWDLDLATGKSCAIVTATANVEHGAQAFSMTNPGAITGPVSLTTKDFYAIGENQQFLFSWYNKNTVATVNNSVYVHWYDRAQTLISTTTLFSSSTANPTDWFYYQVVAAAPAGARFFKMEISGLDNTVAGTAYWDGVTYGLNYAAGPAIFSTGAGSYTYTPYGRSVRLKGAGGGGGGGGGGGANSGSPTSADGVNGGDGGDTTITANGVTYTIRGGKGGGKGVQAAGTGAAGGAGGAALTGTATAGLGWNYGTTAVATDGGSGAVRTGGTATASSPFQQISTPGAASGGSGAGGSATAAMANTGSGGSGGAGANSSNSGSGGGGGSAAEVAEYVIPCIPGVAISITIGLGGRGGAGGTGTTYNGGAGADGSDGFLIVEG